MIIQSIHAENFRRYEILTIEDIPEKGLITIDGNNEAGKSTISDALCFSLFGRTFLIDRNNTHKLVNWDSDYCATTVQFRKGGTNYSLTRTCDKEGLVAAQLLDDEENIIADEVKEVDEKLLSILGYGYETFADSFYLMQRELTTPDSDSIKTMVGINEYADLIDEFNADSQNNRDQLDVLRPQFEDLFQEIENIGVDETWLPELVEARESLENLNTDKQKYTRLLDQTIKDYPKDQPHYQATLSRYNIANMLSNILLPFMIMIWVLWGLSEFFPKVLQKAPLLLDPTFKNTVLMTGLVVAAFYAVSLFYSWWLDGKTLQPLKRKADEGQRTLSGTLTHINQVDEDIPDRVKKMLVSIAETSNLLPKSSLPQAKDSSFISKITNYTSETSEATQILVDLKQDLKQQRNVVSRHQDVLNNAIEAEMARADEAGQLRQKRNKIGMEIKACSRKIKVNDQANQLLKHSAAKFSAQFNQIITETSSRILPSFTGGHYSQIKIDNNIQVKIFSNEKDDFIDFDEVSSGTQRQIMLSLRFAMSEQLAINKDNQQQFILLDEPFAFFDHERTVETLEALPESSDVVNQIWVFSQEFPKEITASKAIHCDVSDAQLLV